MAARKKIRSKKAAADTPKTGRPSSYSEAVADQICDAVAEGRLITDICDSEGFPSYKTFRKWRAEHESFSERIARAREDQMDYYADRIMRLNAEMNATNWQYTNAQIRNIQWLMGKLKAATYGERTALTGADGGAIKVQKIEREELIGKLVGRDTKSEA